MLETKAGGQIVSDQRYYAYGKQRDAGPVGTDYRFTGQQQDGSGLMYFNARYYDPALGQFISPDTLVPDPGVLIDYNRYGYARGNPMKYNDPSGHYSNDEIMQHYGCGDWACVEAHFSEGGSHAGLWGWLYILQQAVDGDEVTSWLNACTGGGCSPQGAIGGVFNRTSSGSIDILYFSGILDGNLQSGQRVPDGVFAYFASGRPGYGGYDGYYSLTRNGRGLTGTPAHSKHNYLHIDPVAAGLTALKAGKDIGPVIAAAAPGACMFVVTCLAAPVIAGAGAAYTAVGWGTWTVVDVIGPAVALVVDQNLYPAAETAATNVIVPYAMQKAGGAVARAAPYVGTIYDAGRLIAGACWGTGCPR